jgi:hypothetical protein
MNKNMFGRFCIVLPLAVILPACTGFGFMGECKKARLITISLQSSKIRVAPSNFCAAPGDAIRVNIVPPQQKETVKTIPKPGHPDWLKRSNQSHGDRIIIEVPADACAPKEECEYSYSVEAPGKNPLDPMITIRR